MRRHRFASLVTSFAAALPVLFALTGLAAAAPPMPTLRQIPAEYLDFARVERQAPAPMDCASSPWAEPSFEDRHSGDLRSLNQDDDAAHYCRGNVMIVHVFMDHNGGSWDFAEKDLAAARASDAKYFFTAAAPPEANVSFDEGQLGAYLSYTVDLGVDLPDSVTWAYTELALNLLGFTDDDGDGAFVDDATLFLQTYGGGFDQVILCFEPADMTGRPYASYQYSRCMMYTDDYAPVFAHEWGHLFGSCDEYIENFQCGQGQNCGPCQSEYLSQTYDNSNCQLPLCPLHDPCLMVDNSYIACLPTLGHWAWLDGDSNGQLDHVKRRVFLGAFVDVYELWEGGYYQSTDTFPGLVYAQRTRNWAVAGIRPSAGGDQNLLLYGDDNHEHLLASSTLTGPRVDFVVGDYHLNNLGNEHLQVTSPIQGFGPFTVQYESGGSMLYADGLARGGSFAATDVVRIWDVPLDPGEWIDAKLTITSGSLDLGMALFDEQATDYFAPRSGAFWEVDASGAGGTESHFFKATHAAVYGLVVFSKTAVTGTFDIQLGPAPLTLPEETATVSAGALALYEHFPNADFWEVVGARPPAGEDLQLRICDDPNFLSPVALSGSEPNVELVAIDHNHTVYDRLYDRVADDMHVGGMVTSWEHDADFLLGVEVGNWPSGLVAKVWDAWAVQGQEYMLRGYHNSLDSGLLLFSSADGEYVKNVVEATVSANSNTAADGEWLTYTSPIDDWVGVVQFVNSPFAGVYQNWWGPRVWMADGVTEARTDRVVWGRQIVPPGYWNVWGVRHSLQGTANVSLYGDEACTSSTLKATDQNGNGVNYVVGDFHHSPPGTYWQRMWFDGEGTMSLVSEGAAEQLVQDPGGHVVSYLDVWNPGDVVAIYDADLKDARLGGDVYFRVDDLSGVMDLGIAIFDSRNTVYFAEAAQAAQVSDTPVVGGSESFVFHPIRDDWYGFVVTNRNTAGGSFRIQLGPSGAVDAPVVAAAVPDRLQLRASPNPFRGATGLSLALPLPGNVDVTVLDVTGRRVRALSSGPREAGWHALSWDGRDAAGAAVSAGIYFVRLRAGGETRTVKAMRLP